MKQRFPYSNDVDSDKYPNFMPLWYFWFTAIIFAVSMLLIASLVDVFKWQAFIFSIILFSWNKFCSFLIFRKYGEEKRKSFENHILVSQGTRIGLIGTAVFLIPCLLEVIQFIL